MKTTVIYDSIKSPYHKANQDRTLVIKDVLYNLYFLFDGVGSATNPIKGINLAIKYIKQNHKQYYYNNRFNLSKLLYDTNQYILAHKVTEPYTTCCAVAINFNIEEGIFVSLGDSRLYAVSNQYITQQTKDDKDFLMGNSITKCLGMVHLAPDDFIEKTMKINPNEKLLICSDGFYNIMLNNIKRFSDVLNFNRLGMVMLSLKKEIYKKNKDDASYLLIKIYV